MVFWFAPLALAAQPIPGLDVWEPVSANIILQTFRAACPGVDLKIEGYGSLRPRGGKVRVLVNGVELRGDLVDDLKQELDDTSTVYRLTARCTRPKVYLQLEVYKGRKVAGRVRYMVSRATFGPSGLLAHRPESSIEEIDFWFS